MSEIEKKEENIQTDGYSLDLFFEKEKAMMCKCSICNKPCREPVELSCECHDDDDDFETSPFCRLCLKKYLSAHNNKCPYDGHEKATFSKSKFINSTMNKLEMKCPANCEKWKGKFKNLKKHLAEECPLRTVKCTYALKEKELEELRILSPPPLSGFPPPKRQDPFFWCLPLFPIIYIYSLSNPSSARIRSVSNRTVTCNWMGEALSLDNHLSNECILRPGPCDFSRVGCAKTVKVTMREKHNKKSISEHLEMAMNAYDHLKSLYDEMKAENDELKIECEKLRESEQIRLAVASRHTPPPSSKPIPSIVQILHPPPSPPTRPPIAKETKRSAIGKTGKEINADFMEEKREIKPKKATTFTGEFNGFPEYFGTEAREIVTIAVGGCGNRLGQLFWDTIRMEHQLNENGEPLKHHNLVTNSRMDTLFRQPSPPSLSPLHKNPKKNTQFSLFALASDSQGSFSGLRQLYN